MYSIFQKTIIVLLLFFVIALQSQNSQLDNYTLNDGLPQSQVIDIVLDDTGYLWLGTNGGGIARFDGEEFKVWNEKNGLVSNFIISLAYIKGFLFIGTRNGLSVKTKNDFKNHYNIQVHKALEIDNTIYLATNKGVKRFVGNSILEIDIDSQLNESVIYNIEFDGTWFWIDSEMGIFKIENLENNAELIELDATPIFENEKNIRLILNNDLVNTEIGIDNINKVIKDKHSIIWMGTSKGLYKLSENSFKQFFKGNTIDVVHESTDGLWVGGSNKLVRIDSSEVNRVFEMNQKITSIASTSKGLIFAATQNNVFVLDSLKVVDTIDVVNDIGKILVHDNKVWLASSTDGISSFSYDSETGSVFNFKHFGTSDGIYDLSINDMQFDRIGRLWYVSRKGFLGYIENNIVKHLGKKLNINADIGTLVFHDTKLFLGTHGKGIWWSEVNEELKFNQLSGSNNQLPKNINQLLFDSKNNLWAGTQDGVYQISVDSETNIKSSQYYDKNDGFVGVETTQNAIVSDTENNIWFGTVDGLIKFEPSENQLDTVQPTIHFETIEVAGNAVDTLHLSDWTNTDRVLILKPTDNNLSFTFKTVDLNHPNEVEYRWRLNATDWSSWDTTSKINFASLESNNYLFEVQSRTVNRMESDSIKFQFHIETPLIQKLWFKLSLAGVLLLMSLLILWNYLRNLKIKNKEKQSKLELQNHLLSLEQKALQLQMNPHFIFNVLNGIKAMGISDTDKMNTTINKFAVLLRMTLSNSRQEHISLAEEIKTLENYIEVEQLMNEKQFEYSISVDVTVDTEEVLIPPMLLQPFVENAIGHGINAVDRIGALQISFEIEKNELHCTVQDNGIGIEQSKLKKVKTNHQSVALDVTRERIESLSGENSFRIEELKDENGKVLGTKVSFKIPLLTDY